MKKKVLQKIIIFITAFVLVSAQVCFAYASDDQRESLEEYLEELKVQIESNNQTLDDIYNSIYEVNDRIAENNAIIEELEISLSDQKAAMIKRIQYMYEAGASMDILLALLTAESIADSLNKTAYISQIVSYDRDMLETYVNTLHAIDNTQKELEERRNELINLRDSFEDAKYDFSIALEEATTRLEEYDIEASQVQEIIEEIMDVEEDYYIPDPEDLVIEDVDFEDEGANTEESSSEVINDESEEETEEDINSSENESLNEDSEETTEPDTEEVIEEETEEVTEKETEEVTEEYTEEETEEDYSEDDDGDSGYYIPISTYNYSDEEIYDLARVTYLEDGCVYGEGSYRSVYLCACVILNRANNWYGGSISAAIYASGQYATAYKYTSWGGGPLVINDITWQAVNDALSNCDPNPYYQCNGQHLAGMGLVEYSRDPGTDEVFYYGR